MLPEDNYTQKNSIKNTPRFFSIFSKTSSLEILFIILLFVVIFEILHVLNTNQFSLNPFSHLSLTPTATPALPNKDKFGYDKQLAQQSMDNFLLQTLQTPYLPNNIKVDEISLVQKGAIVNNNSFREIWTKDNLKFISYFNFHQGTNTPQDTSVIIDTGILVNYTNPENHKDILSHYFKNVNSVKNKLTCNIKQIGYECTLPAESNKWYGYFSLNFANQPHTLKVFSCTTTINERKLPQARCVNLGF